jgi:hypothetical protein
MDLLIVRTENHGSISEQKNLMICDRLTSKDHSISMVKRMNSLLILEDYSQFLVSVKLFASIKTEDVTKVLNRCIPTYELPGKILADDGSQFRDTFDEWCTKSKRGIEVVHAPPFYLQCKGKIERCIRNFNEEYIRLDSVFEDIPSFISDYREWYNTERYNAGVDEIPQNLYMSKHVTDVT